MTPEAIALAMQVVGLLERISTLPFMSLLVLLVFGPPTLSLANSYIQQRQLKKVEDYYRSNVKLVENYETVCKDFKAYAEELRDIVVLNTREWSSVKECIQGNQYCPLLRKDRRVQQSIVEE